MSNTNANAMVAFTTTALTDDNRKGDYSAIDTKLIMLEQVEHPVGHPNHPGRNRTRTATTAKPRRSGRERKQVESIYDEQTEDLRNKRSFTTLEGVPEHENAEDNQIGGGKKKQKKKKKKNSGSTTKQKFYLPPNSALGNTYPIDVNDLKKDQFAILVDSCNNGKSEEDGLNAFADLFNRKAFRQIATTHGLAQACHLSRNGGCTHGYQTKLCTAYNLCAFALGIDCKFFSLALRLFKPILL